MSRVDLGALMAAGVPDPELICDGRVYLGMVHLLAGKPESGKTTLAAIWALWVIRKGGLVVIMDEESGARKMARKMTAIGATPEEASAIEYHPFPGGDLAAWRRVAGGLAARTCPQACEVPCEHFPPMLIIADSAAKVLARAGLKENDAGEVTALWTCLIAMARSPAQPAVVVLDHLVKADQQDSQYSRGSGAKLESSDVMYRLDSIRPFTRDQDGAVRLVVTKDNEGCLTRYARFRVSVRPHVSFDPDDGGPDTTGWAPAKAKVLEALDATWRMVSDLTDRIAAKHGHGLKRPTMSQHLTELERDGHAERRDTGTGKPALWRRAGTDEPDAEPPTGPGDGPPPAGDPFSGL